jgi:hypothetical protein
LGTFTGKGNIEGRGKIKVATWIAGSVEAYAQSSITAECIHEVVATGGIEKNIEQDGNFYRVHTFNSVGTSTFSITQGGEVEYLIVGGGGGGGSNRGAGGGAGGMLTGNTVVAIGSNSVVVGEGGLGRIGGTSPTQVATNGGNSSALGFTANGGGFGGAGSNTAGDGNAGGSGGGSAAYNNSKAGGIGTSGQGNKGSDTTSTDNAFVAGGGGGASIASADVTSATSIGIAGGDGLQSSISGTSPYYAGGGGGYYGAIFASGGLGGGGRGSGSINTSGSRGGNRLGGGGGGGGGEDGSGGGDGGSGVVIIRYRITRDEYEASLVSADAYASILATNPTVFVGLEYAVIGAQQVLWQDAAGTTTPVTAVGDPIGCVRHPLTGAVQMSQSVLARRPLWLGPGAEGGAQFDGVDDRLELMLPNNGTNSFTVYTWITQDDTFNAGGLRGFLWHEGQIRFDRGSTIGGPTISIGVTIVDSVDTNLRDSLSQWNVTVGLESFAALVVDRTANSMKFFFDGESNPPSTNGTGLKTPLETNTLGTATQLLSLGAHPQFATRWLGKIRAMAYLQEQVVPDADIESLFNTGPV